MPKTQPATQPDEILGGDRSPSYRDHMFEACVRCGAASLAVMSYSYAAAEIWLDDLAGSVEPGSDYALCGEHAARLSAPVGWTLADRRTAVRLFAPLEVA